MRQVYLGGGEWESGVGAGRGRAIVRSFSESSAAGVLAYVVCVCCAVRASRHVGGIGGEERASRQSERPVASPGHEDPHVPAEREAGPTAVLPLLPQTGVLRRSTPGVTVHEIHISYVY